MTTQDRTVITIVLCVVLAAAGWFLLIKPKRGDIAQVNTEIQQAQIAADESAAAAAAARAAKSEYQTDYAAVVRLGKAVPLDDDVASLVYQLEQTAEDTGVDFRSVTVTEGAAAAPAQSEGEGEGAAGGAGTLPGEVKQIPVTLTFDGGYFAMTRFLRKVERYTLVRRGGDEIDVRGRLLAVNTVKLTPGAKGFPDVNAEVSVTAYSAPLPSVDGADTAAASGGATAAAAPADAGQAAAPAAPSTGTENAAQPTNATGGDAQ